MHDMGKDEHKPSKAHFWGGALTGGATVPFSWAAGGTVAAKSSVMGAVVGGLLGLNGLFDEDEDNEEEV